MGKLSYVRKSKKKRCSLATQRRRDRATVNSTMRRGDMPPPLTEQPELRSDAFGDMYPLMPRPSHAS
jgi:hypothetical protein